MAKAGAPNGAKGRKRPQRIPSALTWYRMRVGWRHHRKVRDLQTILEDDRADIFFARLLDFTSEHALDGVYRDGVRSACGQVEEGVGWNGKPGVLVAAMLRVGMLERRKKSLEVHDWWEEQGVYVLKAARDAARKRAQRQGKLQTARAARAPGARTARGRRRDGAGKRREEESREEKNRSTPPTQAGGGVEKVGWEAWEVLQQLREQLGLGREPRPPSWAQRYEQVAAQGYGLVHWRTAYVDFLRDEDFKHADWRTAIFLSPNVSDVRLQRAFGSLPAEKRAAQL